MTVSPHSVKLSYSYMNKYGLFAPGICLHPWHRLEVCGESMTRFRQWYKTTRFKLGKFCFPAVEPLCILKENLRPEVRKHFDQAIKCIEKRNIPVGLLNLNMVLSLSPNHFLARVYRGRIYLRESQFRLASDDFIQANRISSYRFTHYNLYREYLVSVNHSNPAMENMTPDFEELFKGLVQAPNLRVRDQETDEPGESADLFQDESFLDEDLISLMEDLELTWEERERFGDMGPITGKEVDNTNWDLLIKKLRS